ncbi:MAG: hypothetical protein ABI597_01340 [Gammaproteobacteria bacterium]
MKMRSYVKFICLVTLFFMLPILSVRADPPIIVNNNNNNNTGAGGNSCNNNVTTDPRVPPAGVYSTRNGNGTSNTIYTTGETKPYIVDNNCNSNAYPSAVQPNVYVQPRFHRR